MLDNHFMLVLSSADLFQKSLENTPKVSNGLNQGQNRHSVDPNCLQRSPADDKRRRPQRNNIAIFRQRMTDLASRL